LRIRGHDSGSGPDWQALNAHLTSLANAPANAIGAPVEILYTSAALAIVALVLGIGRLVREI
jgi:hypothetical protein